MTLTGRPRDDTLTLSYNGDIYIRARPENAGLLALSAFGAAMGASLIHGWMYATRHSVTAALRAVLYAG